MASTPANLPNRMRAIGAEHARGAELIAAADALDKATAGYFAEPQTVKVQSFMGAYARAKSVWSECSGEPLVPQAVVETGARLLSVLSGRG